MSAPLYSRYRRYADREARRFHKGSMARLLIPKWKRPHTRVYSLSDRASYEAGAWSSYPPAVLIKAMGQHYLPTYNVWIELDFLSYQQGVNRIPYESENRGSTHTQEGVLVAKDDQFPVRMAVLLFEPTQGQTGKEPLPDHTGGTGCIAGLLFYLFPTGTSFIAPVTYGWYTGESEKNSPYTLCPERQKQALSPVYAGRYANKNPRTLKRLMRRVHLEMVGTDALISESKLTKEVYGTTRLAIAALSAALSARSAQFEADMLADPNKPLKGRKGGENRQPIEVDLFLRDRPKRPGGSINASIGALETLKKGLHTVGGHWAYRRRKDDNDPTQCPKGAEHLWESIEGTKTQVCLACGQKRWFRDQHQRGDAKYGVASTKTYNVHVSPQMNSSSPEVSDGG